MCQFSLCTMKVIIIKTSFFRNAQFTVYKIRIKTIFSDADFFFFRTLYENFSKLFLPLNIRTLGTFQEWFQIKELNRKPYDMIMKINTSPTTN